MAIAKSRQLVEQRLGVFQIERVEAFGEPAVDRSEKIAACTRSAKFLRPVKSARFLVFEKAESLGSVIKLPLNFQKLLLKKVL